MIQAALFFYARSVALQSAREGVSQLRLFGQSADDCNGQVANTKKATETYAKSVGSGALTGVNAVPTCQYRCKGDSRVLVVVHGRAISLIGLRLGVQEQAEGRVETFQPYSSNAQDDSCPNG